MKKFITILLILALTMVLVTGCKGNDTQGDIGSGENSTGPEENGEIDHSQLVEYSIWLYADDYEYYASYDDNPVVTYLNEKFNIKMTFQQPPMGNEAEAISTMLGTGEYTDLINAAYAPDQQELFEDGVIVDIAPYVDEYMPNLKAFLEGNPEYVKDFYDEEGRFLNLMPVSNEEDLQWGGFLYRHDILETMTGGNVAFPSGKEEATTIADWEYILELMDQYFQAAAAAGGMSEYAGLILPAMGYFQTGELVSGFGIGGSYYLDGDTVKYGPMEEGFYNYLEKMKEWYEKGFIYQDFASRTNDPFYLPNTALTYGGAAGIWYGLSAQLGDVMSLPEYELYMDVRPLAIPLDIEHGIDSAKVRMYSSNVSKGAGLLVSSSCENIERLLEAFDYLYSEEGAMVKRYGLIGEAAANSEVYQKLGIDDGAYTLEEDKTFNYHPLIESKEVDITHIMGLRLPGMNNLSYAKEKAPKLEVDAHEIWSKYGKDGVFPENASQTAEESKAFTATQSNIDDYVNSMVTKFIMGSEELSEESFAKFVDQIKSLDVKKNINLKQAAYDRYMIND